jgi:CheY-like chemotaxis protein
VVEDEAQVRSTIRRQLEMLGHTVMAAESAAAAIELLKSDPAPNLMITDVVLGDGMNGIDLADRARVLRPTLPIIFISGFSAVPEAQQRISSSGAPLLSKPSTLSQLERAINAVTMRSPQDTSRS